MKQTTSSAAQLAEPESAATEYKTFRLGELFSGPGGLGWAAKAAKNPTAQIVHQWATDYDADTCKTYAANVCGNPNDPSVVHADIRDLNYQRLHELGGIDGLAFGFPCNDFSIVGERLGFDGKYGPLYTYGLEALRQFKPAWFLAENVGGIRAKGGMALKQILADMVDAGYKVYPHYYKFEEYGIPQARHRMIVIGIRDDIDREFGIPSPGPYADVDVSAQTALSGIPAWATNQEKTRQSNRVIERLSHIPAGGNAWVPDMPAHLQINTRTKLSSIYRRLDAEKPSYTVTGSGGGGTHIYHWSQNRALTNRERARLQTFDDKFVFYGSKESVRKQIGMAVPPRGATIIFEAILNTFTDTPYEKTIPSLAHLAPES
ncbi:DNA (cytosine-5-)-methyltransferase [Brevibacterium sp. BDJS002]|uniref:DNA cytosine methyltransferase n=1 Tax=Brevibacterium sp. BDJS002 TaxID=3020906 RepID=UPI002306FC05|nr:DNA (cytosine-5-)-methyltransferase [Brevibacterium sp. BDJS002]WCE40419.1 DNA (cytosine-5-)-methyltransferase [Brevibacterium sp. BDJS002]